MDHGGGGGARTVTEFTLTKIHKAPALDKQVRLDAPSDLLILFDASYDLSSRLKSDHVDQLQLKLQSEKITEMIYDKTILKAHEIDYLTNINRKTLSDLGENLFAHLTRRGYLNDPTPSWLTRYTTWRNNFNGLYKLGYQLP